MPFKKNKSIKKGKSIFDCLLNIRLTVSKMTTFYRKPFPEQHTQSNIICRKYCHFRKLDEILNFNLFLLFWVYTFIYFLSTKSIFPIHPKSTLYFIKLIIRENPLRLPRFLFEGNKLNGKWWKDNDFFVSTFYFLMPRYTK